MSDLISNFYQAFHQLDAKKMASYYHKDVIFEDPAFGVLKGKQAHAMWHMLCESQKGKDFRVEASNITENSAHWEAFYTFSKTGRKVHNKIDATFEFKDGLIIKHTDHFNLHTWAKQAIGFKGWLLGGTDFFRKKLQSKTNYLLKKYMAEKKATKLD
ncbi:nuclear transport factor 2 family protein [Winogradskyella marincola]|uniref:Nuclear transport factor 2 family protein n=1 Tax=Winogradskyella marincola TaxID=3037795 RepID=A0ABT6G149_9FLAO|nr:nuclear transport factor 2 family protein [Winogradskyella sp. YYF002]MDG4715767.1 nuclear transport factor 2 family protein [Winogradskyella sp. YYF002]